MVLLNLLWIIVTLVTDWQTCFYRKAAVYKKRVEDAVEQRRRQMAKAQEKSHNESSTATFVSSLQGEGHLDKSIGLEAKEMDKTHDDLLAGDQTFQRSDSFKRFVQYEALKDNIDGLHNIDDHDQELEDRFGAVSGDTSPYKFRRESRPNARISLMK